jgi:hypothetical protein
LDPAAKAGQAALAVQAVPRAVRKAASGAFHVVRGWLGGLALARDKTAGDRTRRDKLNHLRTKPATRKPARGRFKATQIKKAKRQTSRGIRAASSAQDRAAEANLAADNSLDAAAKAAAFSNYN